jgi:hypothetical protein
MGAMIIAEAGDFSRFDSAGKLLAYAGMPFITPPSTSAIGMNPLPRISPKNGQKVNIIMLTFPMLPRNLCG